MPPENGPQFLDKKFNSLRSSAEVDSAAERTVHRLHHSAESETEEEFAEHLTKERALQNPTVRIQNYLDRFNEILERQDPAERERGIKALKRILHDRFVIKPEEVPEDAFILQQTILHNEGWGNVEITDDFRTERTNEIINDQTASLDRWLDYLSSPDAMYPDWAKYWVLRSVLEMGKLEKKVGENGTEVARFQTRGRETVASFPPLNPRALALTIGVLQSRLVEKGKPREDRMPIENASIQLSDTEFQNLLTTENFSKIYLQFLIEMPEYSAEGLQETRGEWVKFPRYSDPMVAPKGLDRALVPSLEGYPLEWCTANPDTAKSQLAGGDFYVYYSIDQQGQAVIPRVAIRMQDDQIGEVRGIAAGQNLDPYIAREEKFRRQMVALPGGGVYEKKVSDMRQLTVIEKKIRAGQDLTQPELVFLYEIDDKIQGFGYQDDPRVAELRATRDPITDAPIVMDCQPDEISWSQDQINQNTKAYIGPLFPGIFQQLANIEHIYTQFPEGKISRNEVETTGKAGPQLETELENISVHFYDDSKFMLQSSKFIVTEAGEKISTIKLQVRALFSDERSHAYSEILTQAFELGLDLLPHETAADLLLDEKTQPEMGEWYRVVSKPIAGRRGHPLVFDLGRDDDGLWLSCYRAKPVLEWRPDRELLFALRKNSPET